MDMKQTDEMTAFFWQMAAPFLNHDGVTKSTMMGYPCLRVNGNYFASVDPKSGNLVIKLPAERVNELIDADAGAAFSPAGRRFREWIVIEHRQEKEWNAFINEALAFVAKQPAKNK